MKKKISKKQSDLKKSFVANLDQHKASQLLGGSGSTTTTNVVIDLVING